MLTVRDYGRFCLVDPVFYELPERLLDEHDRLAAACRPVPEGWDRDEAGWWVRFRRQDAVLPGQGWTVHVSVVAEQVERAAELVRGYCLARNLPFDLIRSRTAAREANGVGADRLAAGRLFTLYPGGQEALSVVLRELGVLLDGMPGPYILCTLRHRAGPLYVGYGPYGELSCEDAAGERVPALRRPGGGLEPCLQRPVFTLPDWVELPEVLRPDLTALRAKPAGEFPYRVHRALRLGNGSATYLATDTRTGDDLVLREARPHAGLDRRGDDAVARLDAQQRALTLLAGLGWVPRLLGTMAFAEHRFLAVERMEGESLESVSVGFPLTSAEWAAREAPGYTARVLALLERIEAALGEALARGVCLKALHPGQVLVRPDGSIAVVDFASATDLRDERPYALDEEEFTAPAGLCGAAAHAHLVDSLRLWLFLPLPHPQPAKLHTLTRAIEQHFPVPEGFGAAVLAGLRPPGETSREDPAAALLAAEHHDWPAIRDSLVAGIHATATPERTDRLFPSSPTWHRTLGGYALDHGAAGVLYALHGADATIPPEYLTWLAAAAERDAEPRPGLYDGLCGVAYTLDRIGHREQALEVLERCRKLDLQGCPANLSSGLAGIALTLLHFASAMHDARLLDAGLHLTEKVAGRVAQGSLTARRGDPPPYGLLHGTTGAALLFLRAYRETGQPRHLDLAELALRHDIGRCRSLPDGTVMLHDGVRGLPYLQAGSCGLAVPLRDYLEHRPDEAKAELLAAIRRTCEPVYVRNAGLLRGRASVITTLTALGVPPDDPALLTQVRRLGWYAQLYRGHLAFPGFRMRRLSSDLATGSAGVLLALSSAFEESGPSLPFLDPRHPSDLPGRR
ncbi:class III lanthionine synthetase LanKC [Streptomyces sp. NPDC002537]